jgi:hypothetical protein
MHACRGFSSSVDGFQSQRLSCIHGVWTPQFLVCQRTLPNRLPIITFIGFAAFFSTTVFASYESSNSIARVLQYRAF